MDEERNIEREWFDEDELMERRIDEKLAIKAHQDQTKQIVEELSNNIKTN